jgi:protein-S-isoprenylcysteine O-methyltransferase Ste14
MTKTCGYIIIVCWAVFVIVWLVAAFRAKRTVERQSLLSALAHRIPIVFGWWLLAYPRLSPIVNRIVIPRTALSQIVGVAVCVAGLSFTLWARRVLGGNWSSDVTFKRDHELIRTGPYRIVRHPIYTGLLVMCLGTAIEIGALRGVIGSLLVGVGFWIKLNQEERFLLRHFSEAYPSYQRDAKALVPFIL